MNIFGIIVAGILICCNQRPKWYGWCLCFELPVSFGMELGIFFIAPKDSTHTKNHELGHSIQNIYYGPFTVGMITFPSFVRYWIRQIKLKKGIKLDTNYDDIWFEG